MSDTPRTDADEELMGGLWFVLSDLARDLERENAELLAALKEIVADSSCSAYSAQVAEAAIAKAEGK